MGQGRHGSTEYPQACWCASAHESLTLLRTSRGIVRSGIKCCRKSVLIQRPICDRRDWSPFGYVAGYLVVFESLQCPAGIGHARSVASYHRVSDERNCQRPIHAEASSVEGQFGTV